jgi:hypothetical protein
MTWVPITYPLPPMNVLVVSPFEKGALDIRWDDPALLGGNSAYNVLGVNVYRSVASDRGPFQRINSFPVGGTFYRDFTDVALVAEEVIPWESGWQSRGNSPNDPRWTFRTRYPIYKPRTQGIPANSPPDVQVTINGVPAWVTDVFGQSNEITLGNFRQLDPRDDRFVLSPIPSGPGDAVVVSYYTLRNIVSPGVDKKTFYRVTTIAEDANQPGGLIETPLNVTQPSSDMQIEQLDYIWREGMRRNRWILEQGGERVKLFCMKVSGVPCDCRLEIDARSRAYNKQPSNRCQVCYGTGFVGGYEGPYDTIIAPDDAEKRISQTMTGRRKEHTYEVWMSFSPIVSQRDFVVKQNNDRYSIGPVRRPTNRGNVMQQHFNIAYLDSVDIRYSVPIDGAIASPNLPWPQTRYTYTPYRETYNAVDTPPWPVTPDADLPLATDKNGHGEVPDPVQIRWRTGTGENQSY